MIAREDMQDLVKRYREPIGLMLGSHSTLDAAGGFRDYGLRRIIYVTRERARIYLQNPIAGDDVDDSIEDLPEQTKKDIIVKFDVKEIKKDGKWKEAILIVDKYNDILKYMDELAELECIQIPNRAFSVYVGGDSNCTAIENKFAAPIIGSRKLLKIENRGELERDYYWFLKQAGVPHPESYQFTIHKNGIRFKERINNPIVMKAENARRFLEREFIFASDSDDLEEKVKREMELGNLNEECLKGARVEQIILGPHANFNFFFSPLDAKKDWGDVEKAYAKIYDVPIGEARTCLANQFLSIDERRETNLDGLNRLPVDLRQKIKEVPSFQVTLHLPMSLRESLLKDVHRCADAFVLATMKYEPPGLIGAWCLQSIMSWMQVKATGVSMGLYDVSEGAKTYMHMPVTQDIAVRHGGGTNTHMGIGSQYANVKYKRRMSMGDRIALEIKRATKLKRLEEIVT